MGRFFYHPPGQGFMPPRGEYEEVGQVVIHDRSRTTRSGQRLRRLHVFSFLRGHHNIAGDRVSGWSGPETRVETVRRTRWDRQGVKTRDRVETVDPRSRNSRSH